MLRLLLLPAGLALVGLAIVDLLWTTLAVSEGAGPVTRRTSAFAWRAVGGGRPRDGHRRGTDSGVIVVVVVLLSWITLLIAGWLLAFSAAESSVIGTTSGAPATLGDRTYFVGYTVFTLGNGDFKPGSWFWQLATVTATGTGLVLVSLAITYLVPVAAAATDRRSLAGYIASLGQSPEEIVTRSWNGEDFQGLTAHLQALSARIQESGQRHLTYPVLHYFSSSDRRTSAPVAIAVLEEALTLLRCGVAPQIRLEPMTVEPARQAIGSFLDTLAGAFISPADDPLPPPPLAALDAKGIPTVGEDAFLASLDAQRGRRCLLAGLISSGGWNGPVTFVTSDGSASETGSSS